MPDHFARVGAPGGLYMRVTVRPDGSVQRCEVQKPSGLPGLDEQTCSRIIARAKFEPARDIAGATVYGVYRVPVIWSFDVYDYNEKFFVGDRRYTIDPFPKGLRSPKDLAVAVAIDNAGKPIACNDFVTHEGKPGDPALVATACQQLQRDFVTQPVVDDAGRAVPSVQSVQVRFEKK